MFSDENFVTQTPEYFGGPRKMWAANLILLTFVVQCPSSQLKPNYIASVTHRQLSTRQTYRRRRATDQPSDTLVTSTIKGDGSQTGDKQIFFISYFFHHLIECLK